MIACKFHAYCARLRYVERERDFGPAVFWLVIYLFFGWKFWLVGNPWSTFVVIRNRDVTFRGKKKLGDVAVDDDVSLHFSKNWPEKVLFRACFMSSIFYHGGNNMKIEEWTKYIWSITVGQLMKYSDRRRQIMTNIWSQKMADGDRWCRLTTAENIYHRYGGKW